MALGTNQFKNGNHIEVEQIAVPGPTVRDALRWITPSGEVEVLFIDDQPGDLQLPFVEPRQRIRVDTRTGDHVARA